MSAKETGKSKDPALPRLRRTGRRVYSAREKAEAVLALWTEKRRPTEVCQEIGISTTLLMSWQERALEGLLGALEPRTRAEEDRGARLGRKLEKLLEEKTRMPARSRPNGRAGGDGSGPQRLARRLIRVQKSAASPAQEMVSTGSK